MKLHKNILLILLLSLGFSGVCANLSSFLIKGTVKNYFGGTSYAKLLRWDGNDYVVSDSTSIIKSNFTIRGKIKKEEIAYLVLGKNRPIPIFLGAETFFVFGDLNNIQKITILGGDDQKKYNNLQHELKVIDEKLSRVEVKYSQAEKMGKVSILKSLENESSQIHKEKQTIIKNYVNRNLKSLVAVYLIESQLQPYLSNDELEVYVNSLEKNGFGKEHSVATMSEKVNIAKRLEIGKLAPEIMAFCPKGDTVFLSSYRGKYVLVDFWASWCAPSRVEIPILLSVYQNFKNAKFEVLSVFLDDDIGRWKKNIGENKLNWVNVIDVNAWNSDIVKNYAITSIPANVLLDPNGVILSKNIKSSELSEILEELLKSKK